MEQQKSSKKKIFFLVLSQKVESKLYAASLLVEQFSLNA